MHGSFVGRPSRCEGLRFLRMTVVCGVPCSFFFKYFSSCHPGRRESKDPEVRGVSSCCREVFSPGTRPTVFMRRTPCRFPGGCRQTLGPSTARDRPSDDPAPLGMTDFWRCDCSLADVGVHRTDAEPGAAEGFCPLGQRRVLGGTGWGLVRRLQASRYFS